MPIHLVLLIASSSTVTPSPPPHRYVLEHFSESLPSFCALPLEQQKSVRFTQSKMSFNHGWLVQAEAPPLALFGKFKQVIMKERVSDQDVAFYFVHWLTDLAGAEPTPLEGSEKFVLKFPMPVLAAFIKSFSIINELAHKTETQVMEDYLIDYWRELSSLGPVPEGQEAIAIMRLVVQAQTLDKQRPIQTAVMRMRRDDREVLSDEMARTGCADQEYVTSQPKVRGGPAFLVYYSPAFIRKLTPTDTLPALALLAEIYRRARKLWPLEEGGSGTVTVRIDQIKELSLQEIQSVYSAGDSWLLSRRNDKEAVVERHPLDYMGELLKQGYATVVLKFWNTEHTERFKRMSSGKQSPISGAQTAQTLSGAVTPKESYSGGLPSATSNLNTWATKNRPI